MGKLCHQTTVLEDWTSVAQISPEWLVLPRQGHRELQYDIAVVSQSTGEHLADIFRKVTQDWGYDYVKIELLIDEYRDQYHKIRQACGNETVILACFNYTSALGFADLQRVTNDVSGSGEAFFDLDIGLVVWKSISFKMVGSQSREIVKNFGQKGERNITSTTWKKDETIYEVEEVWRYISPEEGVPVLR